MTEVGCLSFTQMFQDYLQEYPSLSQADVQTAIFYFMPEFFCKRLCSGNSYARFLFVVS